MRLDALLVLAALTGCARTGLSDPPEVDTSTSASAAASSSSGTSGGATSGSIGQPGSTASSSSGSTGTTGSSTAGSTGSTGGTSSSSSGSTGTSGVVRSCVPSLTVPADVPRIAVVGSTVWSLAAWQRDMGVYDKATGTFQSTVPTDLHCVDSYLFDGRDVWTGCSTGVGGDWNVTARRADTAEFVHGTSAVDFVRAMAFDGESVWVGGDHSLTRFETQTGTITGTFPAPTHSGQAMAFDGTSLWLTSTATLSRFAPSSGALLGTYPVSAGPVALAFDGADLWLVSANQPGLSEGVLTRLSIATGATLATYPLSVSPMTLLFDGTDLIVGHPRGWLQIDRATGAVRSSCDLSPANITQVIADGDAIWVADETEFSRFQ